MTATDRLAEYRRGAQARRQRILRHQETRPERAWAVARTAAQHLRQRYKAQRIVVFGSLVHPGRFHLRSDVDLAVWGVSERDYYRAVGEMLALDPQISVDLVEGENVRPSVRDAIAQEGIPL
jgi:predicted nucleotidyltransferase